MKFKTMYDREAVPSNAGERVHTLLKPRYDEKGRIELVGAGKVNIYDEIQSHKDSCDIYKILKRFTEGDNTVLSKVQGSYGDFTAMPKTFAEALNTVRHAEEVFNSLPLETRQQFNCSFEQWISSAQSPEFAKSLGVDLTPTVITEKVVPDTKPVVEEVTK